MRSAWVAGTCLALLVSPPGAAASALRDANTSAAAPAFAGASEPPGVASVNLHRVRPLLGPDVRAVWVGDSWSLLHSNKRLPYGSLMVWPVGKLNALCVGFRTEGPGRGNDFTSGQGRLVAVDQEHGWVAEVNDDTGPARIALPVNDISKVRGAPGLVLDRTWPELPRIQDMGVRNDAIDLGDLPPFARATDTVLVRPLFYCPRDHDDLVASIVFADQDGLVLDTPVLASAARPLWHEGESPDEDPPRLAKPSQINASAHDLPLRTDIPDGARLVIGESDAAPLAGSMDYWFLAGGVFYHTEVGGERAQGYYHSGLATTSWDLPNYGEDGPSWGDKRFTNEQLVHWLDVTTLDRNQPCVFILHLATENRNVENLQSMTRAVLDRFRWACAAVGTPPPRFLLVGAFMHRLSGMDVESSRTAVERMDEAFAGLARSEPDCAFVSLYVPTDGTFFSTDAIGGPGTQQAARDWLDANGWSTISFGGATYRLSDAQDGGLDGVFMNDGLHLNSPAAAAFFAQFISEGIQSAVCPGDFNRDGRVDTQDVLAFLNAWTAGSSNGDFNGDGQVNTNDVIAFLNAWNEPC